MALLDLLAAPLYWRLSVSRAEVREDGLERMAAAVVAALQSL